MTATTLEAPKMMSRRDLVEDLVSQLPPSAPHVVIEFAPGSFATTSFIDELVRALLVDDRIRTVELVAADEFTLELVDHAAKRYGVADRVSVR